MRIYMIARRGNGGASARESAGHRGVRRRAPRSSTDLGPGGERGCVDRGTLSCHDLLPSSRRDTPSAVGSAYADLPRTEGRVARGPGTRRDDGGEVRPELRPTVAGVVLPDRAVRSPGGSHSVRGRELPFRIPGRWARRPTWRNTVPSTVSRCGRLLWWRKTGRPYRARASGSRSGPVT